MQTDNVLFMNHICKKLFYFTKKKFMGHVLKLLLLFRPVYKGVIF